MEREVLVRKTFRSIERLPTSRLREVNDYVEFMLRRTEESAITEGLQHLSSSSNQTYEFLNDEPEIYSVNDLKTRFV